MKKKKIKSQSLYFKLAYVYALMFTIFTGCKTTKLKVNNNEKRIANTELNSFNLSRYDSILRYGHFEKNIKELESKGVNRTFKGFINYKNVGTISVLIKPNIGLSTSTIRESIPQLRDNHSAQAAYNLNNFIDLVDTPEYFIRQDVDLPYEEGKRKNIVAGVQVWLEDVSHLSSKEELQKLITNESLLDELEEIAVFDCLIGNKDRHITNFYIRNNPKNSQRSFVAIDHTLTFPMKNGKVLKGYDGSSILITEYLKSNKRGSISDKNLNKIRKLLLNWNTIKEILIMDLEYSAVDAIRERAYKMLATGIVFDPTKLH